MLETDTPLTVALDEPLTVTVNAVFASSASLTMAINESDAPASCRRVTPTAVIVGVVFVTSATSNAPISQAAPWGRATPRWSVVTGMPPKSVQSLAASMATLPGSSAWVSVAPGEFSASGPRLSWAGVTCVRLAPQLLSVAKLMPDALSTAPFKRRTQLPPELPRIVLLMFTVEEPTKEKIMMPAPPCCGLAPVELSEMVLLLTVTVALLRLAMPPPPSAAKFPEMVLLLTVRMTVLELKMPPPQPTTYCVGVGCAPVAALPEMVLSRIVMVPLLRMPPRRSPA